MTVCGGAGNEAHDSQIPIEVSGQGGLTPLLRAPPLLCRKLRLTFNNEGVDQDSARARHTASIAKARYGDSLRGGALPLPPYGPIIQRAPRSPQIAHRRPLSGRGHSLLPARRLARLPCGRRPRPLFRAGCRRPLAAAAAAARCLPRCRRCRRLRRTPRCVAGRRRSPPPFALARPRPEAASAGAPPPRAGWATPPESSVRRTRW